MTALSMTFIDRGQEALRKAAEDWIEEHLKPLFGRLNTGLMSCFGEDFGRSGDLSVIWPLQIAQGLMRRTPFVVEMRNVPFKQQEQVLFYIVDRLPRFFAGAMDARGNGQYLAEQAALRYGSRVEQVMLSTEWSRDNMPRYKAAFEDAGLELPKDADILADHRALVMERGVARIPEGRRGRGRDGGPRHGDSAIAGALAFYASTLNPAEYAYTPAPAARRRVDELPPDDEEQERRDPFWRRLGGRLRASGW
jgi:phage FluMu gp28-like protein